MRTSATPHPTAQELVRRLREADLDELGPLIDQCSDDPRKQVRAAVAAALRRQTRELAERDRVLGMYALQASLGGTGVVLGIDEVGRGAIAGPLAVAAVALPASPVVWGLNDSKQLTPARREHIAARVAEVALAVGMAYVEPAVIDARGMAWALRWAMAAAIDDAGVVPDAVLIDGNPVHVHERERCVVKGDARVACIAAASVVAKVARDHLMVELDSRYPGYHLAECKGYGSPAHIAAVRAHGVSDVHRRTFCGNFLESR